MRSILELASLVDVEQLNLMLELILYQDHKDFPPLHFTSLHMIQLDLKPIETLELFIIRLPKQNSTFSKMCPRRETNLQLIKRMSEDDSHELRRDNKSVDKGAQAILFSRWSEILRAAPVAIGCLGKCYVAASHEKSASIELNVVGSPQ